MELRIKIDFILSIFTLRASGDFHGPLGGAFSASHHQQQKQSKK